MTATHDDGVRRVLDARHHDPFEVLGAHDDGEGLRLRVFRPRAASVRLLEPDVTLERLPGTDLFEAVVPGEALPRPWRVEWEDGQGVRRVGTDPYGFGPQLDDGALAAFSAGTHRRAHELLGARIHEADGIRGVLFAVWAPGAERVSVVGPFNHWDGRVHPMRSRGSSGVFELFVPELDADTLYKFEVRAAGGSVALKSDPFGRAFEVRPATAARVVGAPQHRWQDDGWMKARSTLDWQRRPMSVYEVHLGSWRRAEDGGFLGYRAIADALVPWVVTLGFTHVELMPITEHPLDASWGYQCTGFFAPTSRFGDADDFRYLVERCHASGVGVLLDWVPGHFPRDEHALARFDGTALFEHADPRRGEHPDWGTLTFNYARHEVRSFLLSSACYWLEHFHIDGLRVDAVASMLYLDYSRAEGEWLPNRHGGRENLEAIDFLRELNECVHGEFPGAVVIAEESTAWPQVSRPTWLGGLGFSMKWSMGWMHDTLEYLGHDPVHRRYHHDRLTFGLLYSHTENFMLPFSHDEVVHGKGSLLGRMPGDDWQRFANLRALYAWQFAYPGKKLLFMGAELAAWREWDHDGELDWSLLDQPHHAGVMRLVRDLNALYREVPALHVRDFTADGFEWIDCHDAAQSVVSWLRIGDDGDYVIIAANFTPVPRHGYRLGVPHAGRHLERLNTDAAEYGGSGVGNLGAVEAEPVPWMGRPSSIEVTLPPLAVVIFQPG